MPGRPHYRSRGRLAKRHLAPPRRRMVSGTTAKPSATGKASSHDGRDGQFELLLAVVLLPQRGLALS